MAEQQVEIEIGVSRGQCLDRRIEDKGFLVSEIAAWEKRRNDEGATIDWTFTTEKAREKLKKAYPVEKVIITVQQYSSPDSFKLRV